MLECRNPAPRSRYYSGVSGTRTTTSRGLSGIHRIVWATFALGVACRAPCPHNGPGPAAAGRDRHRRTATRSKPAPLGPLPLFPLRLRWAAELDAPPSAGIATDNRRVFVPLTTGGLIAVNVDNGAVVWRSDVATTVRPAVADDHVYVVGGDALQALDVASGRAAWRVPLTAAVSAPVVARSGWVIAALETGEVLALRGADGTEVWRQQLAAPVVAPPAIDGDRLYLPGADGTVRALSVATGAAIWTQDPRRQHRDHRSARRTRVRRLDRQPLLLPGRQAGARALALAGRLRSDRRRRSPTTSACTSRRWTPWSGRSIAATARSGGDSRCPGARARDRSASATRWSRRGSPSTSAAMRWTRASRSATTR